MVKQLGTLAIAGCAVIVAPALFACIGLVAGVQLQRALIRSSFAMVRGK